MRRVFWMGVGAAVAVVAVQQLRSTWRRYTPEGVAEQVEDAGRGLVDAAHSAWETFVVSFTDREHELTTQLLVTPEGGDPGAVVGRSPVRPDPERFAEDDPNFDF